MKKKVILLACALMTQLAVMSQGFAPRYEEKVVYEGPDVVFRQIDEHTWEGNGNLMSRETVYVVEGNDRALLIDAGTKIVNLDKIVAGITSKPITLVATHVHPDHTGESIKYFSEIYINAADMVGVPEFMKDYKGEIKYLKDGEEIDLGGRVIDVVFTPGHTPGSVSFMDRAAGYGFSGDAFGSGNLLLTTNFSTLLITSQRVAEYMEKYGIKKLYPGHYMGANAETLQRVKDEYQISRDVLDGKISGEDNPNGMLGLNRIIVKNGVRINFGAAQLK